MASVLFKNTPVLVRGGGDLASGAVYRLHRAGFPVIISELPLPRFVRRAVCYGEAVYSGSATVEGITARLVRQASDCAAIWTRDEIPVICDPTKGVIQAIKPVVVVDARMEKYNPDTTIQDAPLVVALGPGYVAGQDCHAVIETNRGHTLGRVIYSGAAQPDTGVPGAIVYPNHHRVLRAPADGYVTPRAQIGDLIEERQVIAIIAEQAITAPFDGVLRGLAHPRLPVRAGMKIGDLDPRGQRENCFTISDKSLAVGGGVLEAVLAAPQAQTTLWMMAKHETSSSV